MRQEGRGDEAQRKHDKNHRQRHPMLERRGAKEMQDGCVDKIMAEEKNRQSDEDE